MPVRSPILVIINPISGGIDKGPLVQLIKQAFQKDPMLLKFFFTEGENDKHRVSELLQEFSPQRIFVAGGDGTIKFATEVTKGKLPMGLFPMGSANGLAENLHLPPDMNGQLEVALGNSFQRVDCIDIDGEICLHISDLGLNAELIQNYEEGTVRGKLGYLLHSIPTLIQSDFPFKFRIHLNGKTLHRKAFLVAVANAKRYGTGATINPQGEIDDGMFEVLVFKKFHIPELLRTFQSGYQPNSSFIEHFQTSSAIIECEKEIPFQIDGEFRGEKKQLSAEVSPIQLNIAVP